MPSESEKNSLDFLTDAMCSLSFLKDISHVIFSDQRDTLTVGQFYDHWEGSGAQKIPFSPGIFLGYMYCGFFLVKDNWSDLLPDILVVDLPGKWGLKDVKIDAPKKKDIKLKYVVRRMRNALGHNHIEFEVHGDTQDSLFERTLFTFWDKNMQDLSDTFQTKLTMANISQLIKSLHEVAYVDVVNRVVLEN